MSCGDYKAPTPYEWLKGCPSGDTDFKCALKDASNNDLHRAIDTLSGREHTKTAIKAIQAELRHRHKNARPCTSAGEPRQ